MRRSDLQKSKQRHLGVLWRDWMLVALAAMCANAGANSQIGRASCRERV